MALIDYVQLTKTIPFTHMRPTAVDAVIFAQLAYLSFDQEPTDSGELRALGEKAEALASGTWKAAANAELFAALARSQRYGAVTWHHPITQLDVHQEKQFSAVSFTLPTGDLVVAFRGTSAAFVDWKEDFNLAYQQSIPSQHAAFAYLIKVASLTAGRVWVVGHSKGGNLATYAFVHAPSWLQAHVNQVVNADGPGLGQTLPAKLQARVLKLVPQTSVIGTLFDPSQDYRVVASTAHGIGQHDPHSWQTNGVTFSYLPATDALSQYTQKSINAWVDGLDGTTKQSVLNAMYHLAQATDTNSFTELVAQWPKSTKMILSAINQQTPETQAQIRQVGAALFTALRQSLPPLAWPKLPQSKNNHPTE